MSTDSPTVCRTVSYLMIDLSTCTISLAVSCHMVEQT